MKTILQTIALTLFVFISLQTFAQVPQKMNYQAVARDASGNALSNKTIGLKFTIRETSASGPDLFAETMTTTTNSMGTFSVEIGGGTAVLGSFSTISWSTGAKFLNIKIDPNGGTSYTDMGSYQLLSVAYAQYAKNVQNNDDADANPTNEIQSLSIAGNQLSISSGNTVTLPTGGGSATPGGANGEIQFNNSGAFGGDNQFFWDNTNKLMGIGTTTPSHKLNVVHGGSTGIGVTSTSGFSVLDIDAASGDAALRFARAGVNQWNIRNRPADDYFEIFELGGGGSRMVIQDATGNVGIGETVNPSYKLDVLHGGSTGIRVRSSSSFSVLDIDAQSGDAALRFAREGVNQWNVRNNPANDDLQIFELGGGGERMVIQNTTGNVIVNQKLGIGTASPSASLSVEGTTKIGVAGVTFSEIKEVTGTTAGAGTDFVAIPYPAGYTGANMRVLSCEINYNGNAWIGLGGANVGTATMKIFYYLGPSDIWIYYNNSSSFQNKAFRMLVMKM